MTTKEKGKMKQILIGALAILAASVPASADFTGGLVGGMLGANMASSDAPKESLAVEGRVVKMVQVRINYNGPNVYGDGPDRPVSQFSCPENTRQITVFSDGKPKTILCVEGASK